MLSPATVSGLRACLGAEGANRPGVDPNADRMRRSNQEPERVVMWRCPVCDELHDDEDDAADCCSEISEAVEAACMCPVCGAGHASPSSAADCCLWHDLASEQRAEVARRVTEGTTWLQAIEAVDGVLPDQLRHLINESPTE